MFPILIFNNILKTNLTDLKNLLSIKRKNLNRHLIKITQLLNRLRNSTKKGFFSRKNFLEKN